MGYGLQEAFNKLNEVYEEDENLEALFDALDDAEDICDDILDEDELTEAKGNSSLRPDINTRMELRKELGRDSLPPRNSRLYSRARSYYHYTQEDLVKEKEALALIKKQLDRARAINDADDIKYFSRKAEEKQAEVNYVEQVILKQALRRKNAIADERNTVANTDMRMNSRTYKYGQLKYALSSAERCLTKATNAKVSTKTGEIDTIKRKLKEAQEKVDQLTKDLADAELAATEEGKVELKAKRQAEHDQKVEDCKKEITDIKDQIQQLFVR